MKKTILFVIMMMAVSDIFAQRGYWSPSGFIELSVENDTLFYVQKRPGMKCSESDIFNKLINNAQNHVYNVNKANQSFFINTKAIISDQALYSSREYTSCYGGNIFILPRIALSIEDGHHIEEIISEYSDIMIPQGEVNGIVYYNCNVRTSDEVLDLASTLHQHPLVRWCEAVKNAPVIKTNTYYGQQFYINNSSGLDLNVEPAWVTSNLSNIKVAVIDCGVENNHEDMSNCIISGYTVGNPTGYGAPQNANANDDKSHGTCCAGIIAAEDNTIGIKGVASGVKIVPVNIFPYEATTDKPDGRADEQEIHEAIIWASNHADVLSCSWFYPQYSYQIASAINFAQNYGRNGKGTPVVFGAGNNYINHPDSVSFPAYLEKVIAVGSLKGNGEVAWYSQRGYGLNLVALGGLNDIVTTGIMGCNADTNHENYEFQFMGTSAACAQVAAIIAMMLSANPDLTEPEVRSILYGSCRKLSGVTYTDGWNYHIGYGLADAAAAVAASLTMAGSIIPTPSSSYQVNNLSSAAHVSWSWKHGSDVPIIQDLSSSGNWCIINNTGKEYIKDYLVGTVYKNNDVVGSIEKYIHTGANFSGTYEQAAYGNLPAIPSTSFDCSNHLLFTKGGTITLHSPSFSNAAITHSGCSVQNWNHSGNTISFKFRDIIPFNPLSPENMSLFNNESLTITGTYANSYETFQFTITGINPATPLLNISQHGNDYTVSLEIHADESYATTEKAALTNWKLDIVNSTTGKVFLSTTITDEKAFVNTAEWDSGFYIFRARLGDYCTTRKLYINN